MTFLNFTLQDPSPLILYSAGEWMEGSPLNDSFAANYSQESFKVTFTAGASATLTFLGDSITIYGAKRPNHGNYTVVLDDDEPGFTGDGNGNNTFQFALWNIQNLTYGRHTAVIANDPSSKGEYFDVDFISIGREIGPPGYTGQIYQATIDDESPFFIYNGSWSPISSSTASNYSLHMTTENGASVSLSFRGSSVELYGLYVNAPFRAQVDDHVPRDLAGPNVDLNAQQAHPQTLLYYMDGLDENKTHVVTLTNTISNPRRPFYIDNAVVRSSQKFSNDTPSHNSAPTGSLSTSTTMSISTSITNSGNLRSRFFPVGAVVGGVVGGVSGLIILTLIGYILLRRSERFYYPHPITFNHQINVSPSTTIREARETEMTPHVLSRVNEDFTISLQPRSAQTTSPLHDIFPRNGCAQPHNLSDHLHGNVPITQPRILQEVDAGRIVLPPMYNFNWQLESQAVVI